MREAIKTAARKAFVILDGTLLRIDRVAMASGRDRPYYSGKPMHPQCQPTDRGLTRKPLAQPEQGCDFCQVSDPLGDRNTGLRTNRDRADRGSRHDNQTEAAT